MKQSVAYYSRAKKHIPGGVNSPVRAFAGVGGEPVFIKCADGAYMFDMEDNKYIDYVGSWGPMILGHAHPEVILEVQQAAERGLSFGAPTIVETAMAEKVCELMPSIDMIRMVSSGTEASMSAIRLARGFTGRDRIVKFEGCYHGHADSLLVKAGSGALTLGEPSSPGVPSSLASHTLTLPYNDSQAVIDLFREQGDSIACLIVEPVAGNMNCVLPEDDFLQTLRDVCDQHGTVLIFDEVMTGFRVALGGAQSVYGISPDLTTLGKVIGGGMPVGAFGGRRDIMERLAPLGPVYQAGTLSGNPIAMTAGLKTLELISAPGFFDDLSQKVRTLANGIVQAAEQAGIPMSTNTLGGMFGLFFTEDRVIRRFEQVKDCDVDRFGRFFHEMLIRGVYLAPSAYEAGFISSAHTTEDIEKTINASDEALQAIK